MCVIEGKDEAGNIWNLKMVIREDFRSNRFDLVFAVNDKQFSLSKIATQKQATQIWEGLCKAMNPETKITGEIPPRKKKELKNVKQNSD